jgi:hypothetical protein
MKLTPAIKEKIDTYFDNVSSENLLEKTLSNYSKQKIMRIELNFYKDSGKWYTTEEIDVSYIYHWLMIILAIKIWIIQFILLKKMDINSLIDYIKDENERYCTANVRERICSYSL